MKKKYKAATGSEALMFTPKTGSAAYKLRDTKGVSVDDFSNLRTRQDLRRATGDRPKTQAEVNARRANQDARQEFNRHRSDVMREMKNTYGVTRKK